MKYIISILMLIFIFFFICYFCGDIFVNFKSRKKQEKRDSVSTKKPRKQVKHRRYKTR